jgi:ABC-2 type transport system ATP-binding protein
MADNIVVIGKGKLIADTSIKELISGSTTSSVFVRATNIGHLEKALQGKVWSFEKSDGGLRITGAKTDDIGKLAFAAGIPILELANHAASLEEAFLELTADSQEFQAAKGGKK